MNISATTAQPLRRGIRLGVLSVLVVVIAEDDGALEVERAEGSILDIGEGESEVRPMISTRQRRRDKIAFLGVCVSVVIDDEICFGAFAREKKTFVLLQLINRRERIEEDPV